MTMWIIIMWTTLIVTAIALIYLSTRICRFGCIKCVTKEIETRKALIGGGIAIALFILIGLVLNFINAIVCTVYFALIWIVCELFFGFVQNIRKKSFNHYYAGVTAIILSVIALSAGWYFNHHVWQTNYSLTTEKDVGQLKIAMFADSHTGTTFSAEGFAKHMAKIQEQNPDIVVVVGDFVDDDTSREDMVATSRILGDLKTKYGVYFVFGNHDKGYYGAAHRGFSGQDLIDELEKNKVKVLLDDGILINKKFYLIGRRDFSVEREQRGRRLSMQEWTQKLDKNKYTIVLDHQPTDYKNQADAEVDLVLSGHTHGGQLFPFNQVGKWIGANDLIYGHEKRNKTDFIVTSGLSDWAIKFKTGTKSEFVMLYIRQQNVKN
ncbi:MAG: metallophosphoesterase [Alphaproteobacteria bacterium]|nr:metallophosphoesterase [Alphaproteobacteria bacterium]